MKNPIYLDYAATTPVDRETLSAALPYYKSVFYNPSSTHALGQRASAAVERAREQCAKAINARADEIYFTSGGTEAVNWAVKCALSGVKKHIAVSAIEHESVIKSAESLESNGYIVDEIESTVDGIITPHALERATSADSSLVCVMTVNNQIGTVQPIKELVETAHAKNALFFTDAVQAVNALETDVRKTNVDLLAVSGHKFYAPKGVGFLYVKHGTSVRTLLDGGLQERGIRAGTHDVPSIVAMGEAIERADRERESRNAHIKRVSTEFLRRLKFGRPVTDGRKIDDIVTVIFDGIDGGRLAVALSYAGVCCSVGSACSAGSATPPKTLVAMGAENPNCAVRFSFGRQTSIAQAVAAARIVNDTVGRLKQ